MLDLENITDEQKAKIRSAFKKEIPSVIFISLSHAALLFLLTFIVNVINVLYVQSQAFGLIGALVTVFTTMPLLRSRLDKVRDRILVQVKEIVKK